MNMKTILTITKGVCIALTVIPPAVEGATIIAKGTAKFIKDKVDNSETLQEIKKRYKLRSEEGIIKVDYTEV